jgi:hypothetical protein
MVSGYFQDPREMTSRLTNSNAAQVSKVPICPLPPEDLLRDNQVLEDALRA